MSGVDYISPRHPPQLPDRKGDQMAIGCLGGLAGLVSGFLALLIGSLVLGGMQSNMAEQDPRRVLIGIVVFVWALVAGIVGGVATVRATRRVFGIQAPREALLTLV